jgi:DNA-binding CsgD family transcriptional regulator
VSKVTAREAEYIRAVADGLTDVQIGRRLFVTHKTVDQALRRLRRKLKASNRAHLVTKGFEIGILP